MMKSERRFVRNVGIKIGDFTYRSDDLCDYINSYVDVKYDPHDMATIYVFRDGKQVCEAYSQELMVFASENGVEQKALKEHLGRQKRQLKKDKETVQEANVSFTEMNEQYVGFNETTGGIELMISGNLIGSLERSLQYQRTRLTRMDSEEHPGRMSLKRKMSTSIARQRKLLKR